MLTSVSAGHSLSEAHPKSARAPSFVRHGSCANHTVTADDGGLRAVDTISRQMPSATQRRLARDGGLPPPDPFGGHLKNDLQGSLAAESHECATRSLQTEHAVRAPREAFSDLPVLISLHRQRVDLQRARQRLDLQCQSVVRRYSEGDKVVAAKRWSAIKKGAEDDLEVVLTPYQMAMEPLEQAQAALEKALTKAVRKHPMASWAKGVLGFGEASLAAVLSEAGRDLSDYRSPAALWKRMGLAVMSDGKRQRRVTGDEALEHGYDARRRSLMWNVSACLIKAQVRKGPADDEARIAIGPLGQVYLDRKAYNLARGLTKFHAHNDAARYIAKRLLRQMWSEARS